MLRDNIFSGATDASITEKVKCFRFCENITMHFIREVVQKWPGKKRFGHYRFLPLFFIFGAMLEFTMIKWEFRGVNFYKTFKRRRAEEIVAEELKDKLGGEQYLQN
ncbi:uncharacterized protein CDAR_118621 [Caerostris darwini]|uniref:Small integral membrane protein 4 n=1 Tax=Caerostris darwini TaxID=1538125 RepID=A0AAV4X0Q7_9ARAC|nr:uncharacterized protein CDAR_118621 [Caerostris darwini]